MKQNPDSLQETEKPLVPAGKNRKRFWILLAAVLLLSVCLFLVYGTLRTHTLIVYEQQVVSDKIQTPFEFLVLSDLHSDSFGEDNEDLVKTVTAAADQTQFIVLAGDLVDEEAQDAENVLSLCSKLQEILPVYYFPGNSELAREDWNEIQEKLKQIGIPVLDKEVFQLDLNGNPVLLGGLYDYSFALNGEDTVDTEKMDPETVDFLQEMKDFDGFRLVVSHRPDSFFLNRSGNFWDLDLVISGHTHGGQIVLPGGQGLWAPDQGWLPQADSGLVYNEDLPIVITSGLSSGKQKLPRWNNPGEVLLVKVNPAQTEN